MALGKGLKPRGAGAATGDAPPQQRPTPDELVRLSRDAAPHLPPARMPAGADAGRGAEDASTGAFAFRMRVSTLDSLAEVARERGMTQKQLVCRGLEAMGVAVAPVDLEDRTPRRRRGPSGAG